MVLFVHHSLYAPISVLAGESVDIVFFVPSACGRAGVPQVSALKQLGFHYVFDTNFTADLTIMEEATELLGRLKAGGPFPMYTSCCPGWINMVEKTYPDLIPNVSSCKSPQQMLGAVAKTYFASAIGRDPSEVLTPLSAGLPCHACQWLRKQGVGALNRVLVLSE